jgi:uncharacterized protein (TIGR02594 family)
MATSTRRDLFIAINGSIDGLQQTMKAGRTVLLDFGNATASTIEQIERQFDQLGSGSADGLAELERNFKSSLSRIRENARQIMDQPTGTGALSIIDAEGAQQAAQAATARAASLRLVAEAAGRAAEAEQGENGVQRAYAVAAAASAVEAERLAQALRDQAGVLENVRGQVVTTGQAQTQSGGAVVTSANAQRFAMMNLGQQFTDFTVQVSTGQRVATAFAQQMPQATFAISQMGGKLEGVANFLSGPWGIAMQVALIALVPLVAKLLEQNDAVAEGVEKLKASEKEADNNRRAQELFATTMEGVVKITREATKANDEWTGSERTATQTALDRAGAELIKAENIRQATKAMLDKMVAEQTALSTPGASDARLAPARDQVTGAVAKLQELLAKQDAELAALRQRASQITADVVGEATKKFEDPIERIKAHYEGPNGLITLEKKRLVAMQASASVMAAQLKILNDQEAAEIKAERDREAAAKRKAPEITARGSLLDSAEKYRGDGERGAGRSALDDLFAKAQINVDPEKTAWCAAFVNAVLATNGLKGTGSLAAKSFLNFGAATNSPQKGDIVVLDRKGGGHVGFFEGFDDKGGVKVLGGNTGNKVAEATFARSSVLGFRRAPSSPQDQETQETRAREQAINVQRQYDDAMARALAENLRAQMDLSTATDDQLSIKLDQIATEKKKLFDDIDAQLAAGKIPGQTKEEQQANADKLKGIVRNTELLKGEAAIRDDLSHTLHKELDAEMQQLDASNRLLQLQDDLATTAKDRRRIALELLANEEKARRDSANTVLADPNSTQAQKDRAKADLGSVDTEHGLRVDKINRDTANPLQAYRDQLHAATDDMNEALQGVAARGVQSLEDGLVGVIDGTESVAGAFKKMAASILADLARIAIEKAIVAGLDALGMGFSTGHVSTGGASHPGGFAGGLIPGFASGVIVGPGSGTSDSIGAFMDGLGLIRVSAGESIMTADATRRYGPMLKAMNDNKLPGFATGMIPDFAPLPNTAGWGGAAQRSQVDHTLTVEPSPLFDVHVRNQTYRAIGDAAQPLMDGAERQTVRRLARPALSGYFG